jgi:hypothetical protein
MSAPGPVYELSRNIEHYLAVLSKVYSHKGESLKLSVIVNSQPRVQEQWTYDNWNGGTSGHALFLTTQESIFLQLIDRREKLQTELQKDLNKVHNCQDEFIAEVFIELEKEEDKDWRRNSGAIIGRQRMVSDIAAARVWGDSGFRVFLSHKTEVKKETSRLKDALHVFGISAFVAHEDILPNEEWQDEIENSLTTMDAFVALLTPEYHESFWTDQEVGFALAKGIPMISVRLGRDPYGFIGKFQGLTCSWDDAAVEIVKLLIKEPDMLQAYIEALPKCRNYDEGITLSKLLPYIHSLSDGQVEQVIAAFNNRNQLGGSWGFNGTRPRMYGSGLPAALTRITGKEYVLDTLGAIGEKRSGRK